MSEELEDIVDNLREPSVWIRILFMVGFALLMYLVIAPVLLVLGLAQALFALITGEDNEKLRGLGGALAEYVHQILNFFTFNASEKPFPFADFPEMKTFDDMQSTGSDTTKKGAGKTASSASASKPANKKKSTKKKSPAKKKANKKAAKESKDGEMNSESTSDTGETE